mgnify:FL=1
MPHNGRELPHVLALLSKPEPPHVPHHGLNWSANQSHAARAVVPLPPAVVLVHPNALAPEHRNDQAVPVAPSVLEPRPAAVATRWSWWANRSAAMAVQPAAVAGRRLRSVRALVDRNARACRPACANLWHPAN